MGEMFYTTNILFVKLSILAFYWRVFGVTNIRKPIYVLATLTIAWAIVRVSILLRVRQSSRELKVNCSILSHSCNACLCTATGTRTSAHTVASTPALMVSGQPLAFPRRSMLAGASAAIHPPALDPKVAQTSSVRYLSVGHFVSLAGRIQLPNRNANLTPQRMYTFAVSYCCQLSVQLQVRRYNMEYYAIGRLGVSGNEHGHWHR